MGRVTSINPGLSNPRMADTPKARLGKYELLLPPIGEGSEGLLYKACCVAEGASEPTSGEYVAVKRLRHIGSELRPDRFQRQAELLRKLDHPGIVRYKDSFVWKDEQADEGPEVYCLVTEWLEGQSLKAFLEQHPTGAPWQVAEGLLRQVLEALAYASSQRVVHRDLKPSNIYLLEGGNVKLIDFGIARPMDAEATTNTTSNYEGTWNWMAPDFVRLRAENFRGDERSDIFSFGVCFYQILTGRLPYAATGEDPQFAYFQRWLAATPPRLVPHPNLNVLKGARSCIQKCLEVERERRFETFRELLEAFGKIRCRQLRHGSETYEYRSYLGKGGFGQVYRGCRLSDGREVALKELVAGQHAHRFVREAKILQKVPHPHLVQYLDFVEVQANYAGGDSRYFLVLEYLPGMPGASLRERIKDTTKEIEPRELLVLFSGYLTCLEHLHQNERRIIHRDIKPGNLYAPAGVPQNGKLFDLGIALIEEGTRTHGQVPGTLDYMPPEFATPDGSRGSPQSDIYSLAVTLYEALTRSLPFPRLPPGGQAWAEYISRSLKPAECSYAHRVFKEYPELVGLLRSALAPDPQQRFLTAQSMRAEIQKILDSWDRENQVIAAALSAARTALEHEQWEETERHIKQALKVRPKHHDAVKLLGISQARRQEKFDTAVLGARVAAGRKDYAEALRQLELALTIQPGHATAEQLLAEFQRAKEALETEHREQAAELKRAGIVTIQLPDETQPASPQLLFANDPLTASTAPVTGPSDSRGHTTTFTRRPDDRGSAASSTDWGRRVRHWPLRWLGSRALISGSVLAITLAAAWFGIQLLLNHLSKNVGKAVVPDAAYLQTRLPELLNDPTIQSDPVLKNALSSSSPAHAFRAEELAALESALANWWTNASALPTNLASLPLGTVLERRARQEILNQTFPGLHKALQGLDESCRRRKTNSAIFAGLMDNWLTLDTKIGSSLDLAAWRGFTTAPGLFQTLVKRDFEQQLLGALGGANAAWTPAQYAQGFDATRDQVLSNLARRSYRPPEKLVSFAKFKEDGNQPAELRELAELALTSEIQALQAIAQGQSSNTFISWLAKLETYRPLSPGQLAGVPSLEDLSLVEKNVNDCANVLAKSSSFGSATEAAQRRLSELKKRLAVLKAKVQALHQAASHGLVSQERLASPENKLSAELWAINSDVTALATNTGSGP